MSNERSEIRQAISSFDISPRVEPNEAIALDRAFFPAGHRGVLDSRRQLIVGNRGMGKSFWTHALTNPEVRSRLADFYGYPHLKNTLVVIGFNGSSKVSQFAPTLDEIHELYTRGKNPDLIWRGVLVRIAHSLFEDDQSNSCLNDVVSEIEESPGIYSSILSRLDEHLGENGKFLLVVFDALDRLGNDWQSIRALSRGLLRLAVGLQSFTSIRSKIFMRVDQFADQELFSFPDSSKIRNDRVNLIWQPSELYGLLLFEIIRSSPDAATSLQSIANLIHASKALPIDGSDSREHIEAQRQLIHALAGEFMGSNKKRGLVYTWVPLHLSDAANTCSPRTFLIAWQKAAEHLPAATENVVNHLGLLDGVRSASTSRLNELYEDYGWIRPSLEALRREFVPMQREQLFELWQRANVIGTIKSSDGDQVAQIPARLADGDGPDALLEAMKAVAVMEERSNGKINVPDIFRVEAEILRRGGVAVPKRV